jgi:hypothetical protein
MSEKAELFTFLDSDLGLNSRWAASTPEELLRRPWKAYWRLNFEQVREMWASSKHPEVLSWRLNSDDPFDRPWRNWCESINATQKELVVEDRADSVSLRKDQDNSEYSVFR